MRRSNSEELGFLQFPFQNENLHNVWMRKRMATVQHMIFSSDAPEENEPTVHFLKKLLSLYNLTYFRFSFEKLDAHLLLEEVMVALNDKIKCRNIFVRVYGDQEIMLFSSPELIKLILQNVLENAVNFSKLDIDESYIEVDCCVEDNQLKIKIEDNGIGIPEDHLPFIFQPFYSGDISQERKGLGLHLVKKALEVLGGTVHAESVAGCYTKVMLTLPFLL